MEEFTEWYFAAVSQTVASDLDGALLKDCKEVILPESQTRFTFAQLTLWDGSIVIREPSIMEHIMNQHANWFISILCISENKNYILASSELIGDYFTRLLNLRTCDDWLVSDRLYLRKEVIAKMIGKEDE